MFGTLALKGLGIVEILALDCNVEYNIVCPLAFWLSIHYNVDLHALLDVEAKVECFRYLLNG